MPSVMAQPRGAGWQMGNGMHGWMDHPAAMETLQGEVVGLETGARSGRHGGGVHVRLKTRSGEEVSVHLGPSWYLDRQPLKLQVKDSIEVKGVRFQRHDQSIVMAATVKKGSQTLQLRDDQGVPVWVGDRRGCW
ncbi:MAG: hypothetical protein VKJ24_00030 [Synechococcales bacterium]|nr:hypothetical protein [Synechococcales bacterium]